MTHLRHDETSPGLIAVRGPFAKTIRTWPPEGFKEPVGEDLVYVLRHSDWCNLKRFTSDELVRWLEVMDWFGLERDQAQKHKIYTMCHTVRLELHARSRKEPTPHFFSIKLLRCGMCSHGTERLFEATGETHNIVNRDDEPIKSVFVCARCWSDYMTEEE
jgi:hypothetical protein